MHPFSSARSVYFAARVQPCFLSIVEQSRYAAAAAAAKLPSALLRSHKAGWCAASVMAHLWRQINNLCALQVSRFALEAFAKFTCECAVRRLIYGVLNSAGSEKEKSERDSMQRAPKFER